MKHEYSWLYNSYNDNIYTLLFIILILSIIILLFNFWKRKSDYIDIYAIPTTQNTSKSLFYNVSNTVTNTSIPEPIPEPKPEPIPEPTPEPTIEPTLYQAPIETNPANNLFISDAEKNKWKLANEILDGNEESLQNTNGSTNPINDILQSHSTLFQDNYDIGNTKNVRPDNYATVGDYATLDSLGKGLTDTLGGIDSALGYTVLEEQLGTFTKQEISNPHTYDNTSNYYTGMDAKTVNGITTLGSGLSGKFSQNNKPIFLQKDFEGVANIFAPNIIIQNPPLTSDGYPDISFQM